MDNGFYVATENDTSWITGNITDGFQRVVQAPYGAAFGSLCTRPDNTDVVWFGPKGEKNYSDIYEPDWLKIDVRFQFGKLLC
jgi:hypothetical protein